MNKNVEFSLKWGLILGLSLVAAHYVLSAQAHKPQMSPAPTWPVPLPGPSDPYGYYTPEPYEPPEEPFCLLYPNDPLCTDFGGPGQAWL